jgi:hypothetical protein
MKRWLAPVVHAGDIWRIIHRQPCVVALVSRGVDKLLHLPVVGGVKQVVFRRPVDMIGAGQPDRDVVYACVTDGTNAQIGGIIVNIKRVVPRIVEPHFVDVTCEADLDLRAKVSVWRVAFPIGH